MELGMSSDKIFKLYENMIEQAEKVDCDLEDYVTALEEIRDDLDSRIETAEQELDGQEEDEDVEDDEESDDEAESEG